MADTSNTQSSISDTSPASVPVGSGNASRHPQTSAFHYFLPLQHGDFNMLPVIYPTLVPTLLSTQDPVHMNHGRGIYAVPIFPCMGTVTGIPTNALTPLTYSTPTRTIPSEAGAGSGEQSQVGQQQPQQLAPQRQIVQRRFQFAFQVNLWLILKLAALIFLFNQDGSRQRLAQLVFFASIMYLYQTGALAPLRQWVSQAMHRAAAPPRPPRPVARVEPIVRQRNENVGGAANDGQPGGENDNLPADEANYVAENEAAPEVGVGGANHWWGIVKEIQMIVFGFVTSLLPGFHNMDHA